MKYWDIYVNICWKFGCNSNSKTNGDISCRHSMCWTAFILRCKKMSSGVFIGSGLRFRVFISIGSGTDPQFCHERSKSDIPYWREIKIEIYIRKKKYNLLIRANELFLVHCYYTTTNRIMKCMRTVNEYEMSWPEYERVIYVKRRYYDKVLYKERGFEDYRRKRWEDWPAQLQRIFSEHRLI